jgi:hypothetical protein
MNYSRDLELILEILVERRIGRRIGLQENVQKMDILSSPRFGVERESRAARN